MIEIAYANELTARVKLYHPNPDTAKLTWVDTEHVSGDFEKYFGMYQNPSVIPNQDLREAGWNLENRFYFGE